MSPNIQNRGRFDFPNTVIAIDQPKVNWLYTNVSRVAFVVSFANNSQAR
ncbi:hypothetical protein [Microcystis aeruginosa]|uniref:Uncharacterized protein n=1 Tax=Microcystis aeruginosa NIES-2549 TaxID=1641812 RepID=A0A0F6RKS1_MICAE|nr:hypothetical protein [Microcystis aeruginosa]AKE64075.1 hypothetical protein MYAER_1725 [Microcystis aeruginosa NIES-2549]AOC52466.1 hypothetical protein amyaer_1741 [Microcystis aeruginosa NIES-2481]MDB9421071.1 hypothetical protein [Microcystis aeruginosa CS-563/04]